MKCIYPLVYLDLFLYTYLQGMDVRGIVFGFAFIHLDCPPVFLKWVAVKSDCANQILQL